MFLLEIGQWLFTLGDVYSRKLPIVLPENVVERLPPIDAADINHFWQHIRNSGSPLKDISPGHHYPLWIWGDEAQYRENGDEVMLITLGSILDKRKHSVESCYPLSICRSDPCSTFNTVFPVQFSLSCDSNYRYAIYMCLLPYLWFPCILPVRN